MIPRRDGRVAFGAASARSRRLLALVGFAALVACVAPQGGWDVAALEARHPALETQSGQRLGDAPPYWLPDVARSELVLFLCRWEKRAPLTVSLPPDASDVERAILQRALDAWQGAGLGLRFEPVEHGRPDIEIRFAPVPDEPVLTGVGDTIADCAFDPATPAVGARRVEAQLDFASVLLQRVLFDVAGRSYTLEPEQLLGATLHELGHALGYPGHARSRDSIMTTATGEVRRIARGVEKGDAFESPTLAALYALPSGVVVGRRAVERGRLAVYAELRGRARALRGPFVRVGETSARLLWREPSGRAAGSLVVADWPAVLRDPSRFEFVPTPLARGLLDAARPR